MLIHFETIDDLLSHCETNNFTPVIQFRPKKHMNRRGCYLHDVYGQLVLIENGIAFDFLVDEMVPFSEKKYEIPKGYTSEVFKFVS